MLNFTVMPLGILGANCYIVYGKEKSAAIIDPGGNVDIVKSKVEELGLNVKHVILTHAHFDHIFAAQDIAQNYCADIIAGVNEKELLNNPELNLTSKFSRRPLSFDADVYVSDGDNITLGDVTLSVIETPGHTPGGITLYTKGYAFTGDTLFASSVGRCDFPLGSEKMLAQSLKNKLFKLPGKTCVLPGHGSQSTISKEKKENYAAQDIITAYRV
ncbi:MAG: MBL fold metallo-hydrolase [Clostridiales bacterium]|nr:MBL fold metallo-hydrolase [Clostridiales bacterium]